MSMRVAAGAIGVLFTSGALHPVLAQSYPSQPITSVIAFSAGGVADIIARLLSMKMAEMTGATVVNENRGGAAGNLAARAVATAQPDGYTILATATGLAINAAAARNRGFQMSDLRAVAISAIAPDVLAVHPSNPAKTLAEFIERAKTTPTNYGSSGAGTPAHIATEYLLKITAKVDVGHVSFTGGGPAVTAAIGNHVGLLAVSLPTAIAQLQDKNLRGLAVASATRSKVVPDVPTYAESGFQDHDSYTWSGFFVPAKTPEVVVVWLNKALNAALMQPDVQKKLADMGFDPMITTPESAAQFFAKEIESWSKRTQAIGYAVN